MGQREARDREARDRETVSTVLAGCPENGKEWVYRRNSLKGGSAGRPR